MAQEFPTIYRAKNFQEAHLLRNSLEEHGIRAMVTNGVLQGGSGVDLVGWPTLARVMVAEEDAPRAREIALEFDRDISGQRRPMRPTSETPAAEPQVIEPWPCCPQCGARRLTHCPFCHTSGSHFPPADANAGDLLGLPTPTPEAFASCSCGPGGCGPRASSIENESPADEANADTAESPETASPLLLCPTCDEPFHPQYLRRCEWCGHEFPDGLEVTTPKQQGQEPFNWRIAYVIYALALLVIGLAAYLLRLF